MRIELRAFYLDRLLDLITLPLPEDNGQGFSKRLEEALIAACHQMEAPLPLWMERNTREFAGYRQTMFFSEQFLEKTRFDRLQIRLLEKEDETEGRRRT